MMWQSVGLLGRDRLLEQLLPRALGKKPPFILVGARGTGKSAILQWSYNQAQRHGQRVAIVSCSQTVKEIFTELCAAWDVPVFNAKKKQVKPHQVSLAVLERAIMAQDDGYVFIDDIQQATPAFLRRLKVWREHFTIFCAGVPPFSKEELKRCLWGLKEVQVEPLTEAYREQLAKAVCLHVGSTKSPTEIAAASGGMPARIVAMAKGEVETISPRVKGEELNLAPVLLMFGGLAIALRYLGSGLGQTDLYMIGGFGLAIFVCLRYVLLPSMSRG